MAFINASRNPAGFGFGAWMAGIVAKWAEARKARADYLRTLHQLRALSDRELADINISRIQIEDVARRAVSLR